MRVQTARTAAERLVERLGIRNPPVDPTAIAESLGLHVEESDLGLEVSGVLITNSPEDVFILVRASDPDVRKRFTIAHEIGHHHLGHLLGREHVHVDKPRSVMYRGQRAAEGVDLNEIEANNFAASLLMPSRMMRAAVEGLELGEEDPGKLAKRFKVSEQAMTIRLTNLGLL